MLRYKEGLLVESFSRRPEGFTVDHLGCSREEGISSEQAPLAFQRWR